MIHASPILIIAASVRARRLGLTIAHWVASIGRGASDHVIEVIDLKDWRLPMDDEPGIPAAGHYEQDHTLAWSHKIETASAIVFVTPQYNWGYPASLKNAIDHLYKEWAKKPAMIVSYGGHGGGKCAEQLQQILTALNMQLVSTMPALVITRDQIETNTGEIDPAAAFGAHQREVQDAFSELAALQTTA